MSKKTPRIIKLLTPKTEDPRNKPNNKTRSENKIQQKTSKDRDPKPETQEQN